MYINADTDTNDPIETRESVVALWHRAKAELEALGATVIETDFPVVTNYESHGPGAKNLVARGLVPEDFANYELFELSMWSWHDFLEANADPHLNALVGADGEKIFPVPTGSVPGRYDDHLHRFAPEDVELEEYVIRARKDGITPLTEIPTMREGIIGLEKAREIDLEKWMDQLGLDAVVFPAVADVGPADADVNPDSADLAWRNGTWVANGNLIPRHLGIPTVTTPMGVMADIGMPVGLTFAGRGYDDTKLLSYAWAFDHARNHRIIPPRTPELAPIKWHKTGLGTATTPILFVAALAAKPHDGHVLIQVTVTTDAEEIAVSINGVQHTGRVTEQGYLVEASVPEEEHTRLHSEWRGGYGSVIVVVARNGDQVVGDFSVIGGVA
jgi:amidase